MKKTALLFACGLFSLTAQAVTPQSFTQVIQKFATDYKLSYVPENPNQESFITYKFSSNSSCRSEACADLKIYINIDSNCVPQSVGLFGELPVSIPNARALFISPLISDNSSQAHDFMRLQLPSGCYELSMGEQGSQYKTLVDLANRLASAK